ncbi:LEM-3-like GIY-YIG domain-containing protein [Shewanella sp. A14]
MYKPSDIYSNKLSQALKKCGQYVYGYYEEGSHVPFYIGKGTNSRVLDHWKKALSYPEKDHEKKIRDILEAGNAPQIKLLAYNLDESKDEIYSVAERVLQDAFGIQSVWKKTNGSERLEDIPAFFCKSVRTPLSHQAYL